VLTTMITRRGSRSAPGGTEATGSVRRRWCLPSGRGPARPRRYATGIVDFIPGRPPRLLDLVNGRSGAVPADWPACGEELEGRIVTATLDPFRGYLTALADQWAQS
jgi:hypothetical protein